MPHLPPTICVTGATDGLGLALARHYQAQGARLILVGRRALGTLDPALFDPTTYCQADLSQPTAASTLAAFLAGQRIERLDLLIHNAGTGYYGPIEQQSPASINAVISVNLLAPIALTHALLPLLARARGKLVLISSLAAALAVPEYAVYAASKAALDGFARSLRVELAGRVAVQVIRPGAMRTGMHAKLGASQSPIDTRRFPAVAQVAPLVVRAIAGQRRAVTIGRLNVLIWAVGSYAGRPLDWLLKRRSR